MPAAEAALASGVGMRSTRSRDRNRTRNAPPDAPGDPVLRAVADLSRRLGAVEEVIVGLTGTPGSAANLRRLLQGGPAEKAWYSTSELAAAMGVSQYTVTERWANQGRIDAEKDPDTGRWRIPGREYRRLLGGGLPRARKKDR